MKHHISMLNSSHLLLVHSHAWSLFYVLASPGRLLHSTNQERKIEKKIPNPNPNLYPKQMGIYCKIKQSKRKKYSAKRLEYSICIKMVRLFRFICMPFVSFLPFDKKKHTQFFFLLCSACGVGIFIARIVMNLFQLQLNRVSKLHWTVPKKAHNTTAQRRQHQRRRRQRQRQQANNIKQTYTSIL